MYNLEKLDAVYKAKVDASTSKEYREALKTAHEAWLVFFSADSVVASWNAEGEALCPLGSGRASDNLPSSDAYLSVGDFVSTRLEVRSQND